MKRLLTKITSMIRRTRVSLSTPDTGTYPITQVSYLGKTGEIEVIWPYGMGGRLPVDAQALTFNVEGMEENKAGIGTAPTLRFKGGKPGEVWFGNPLSGSVLHFLENGNANLEAPVINLGPSGATLRAIIDERIVALHNTHVHQESGGGSTAAPTVPIVLNTVSTTNTKAS
jgi:hypothetical protein